MKRFFFTVQMDISIFYLARKQFTILFADPHLFFEIIWKLKKNLQRKIANFVGV
jgi:hypothetical protein